MPEVYRCKSYSLCFDFKEVIITCSSPLSLSLHFLCLTLCMAQVEAHLAERARLIKQLEALEEDEDAAQLSMPHIRSLYDEYAAIIGQL
eukprot:563796-Pelagomonas_calceolata.AAC.1